MRLRIEDHQGIETRQMTEKGEARRHYGEDPYRRLLWERCLNTRQIKYNSLPVDFLLPVFWLHIYPSSWELVETFPCVSFRIGIWKCWLLKRVKTGVPGEKPLGAKERTNNKLNPHMASIWRGRRDLNPGHIGGRREFPPLRHPCSSQYTVDLIKASYFGCLVQ